MRHTHIDLNPDEFNQGLHYCPSVVNLDKYNGSYNSLNDPSGTKCVPNKTEDVNFNFFNMIARINELKILAKHISSKCKCKSDGTKCDLNQKRNNEKYQCECKNLRKNHLCEKILCLEY